MQHCDRPLATTKQFRAAVRQIAGNRYNYHTYTDKPKRCNKVDTGERYVKMVFAVITKQEVEAIEFILWVQGVTAHTRVSQSGLRGTCFLPEWERQIGK